MSGTKTLIWAAVLLILGVFYYLYEIQGGRQRQEATAKRDLLLQIVAEDVTSLAIQRAQDPVRAEKRDGHWHITAPLTVRGDDQKYRELVRYLADLRHTRVVEEQPGSLEAYGLVTPRLALQVTLKDQAQPVTLRLGDTTPAGGSYYTQVEGRPAVYLVGGVTKDILDASLHALRDKTVLAFLPAEVQEVQINRGTEALAVLQRQAEDTWRLTAPVTARADDQQVRGLLQRLHDVKVQEFLVENVSDLAPYGLQMPSLHIGLRAGQEQAPLTLQLGALHQEKKGIYATYGDRSRVVLLPQELWEHLPKTTAAVRDKTLLRYERDHVTRLELRTPQEHMVLQSDAPRQYTFEQPFKTSGDGDAIYSWLWDIRDLKALDFVAETPEALTLYGLDVPRWHLALWDKTPSAQEAARHELLIGAEAPDHRGMYARLGADPVIYLVGHAEAKRIMQKTAFDLRDKKILPFTTEHIKKMHVQYPTVQFTVERAGNAWKLIEPRKQDIPQRWKVDHMLYELSKLEYAHIVDESVAQRNTHGLETPQMQVTLWQQDGALLGPLVIGRMLYTTGQPQNTAYAQAGKQAPLYSVHMDFLKAFPKTADELITDK